MGHLFGEWETITPATEGKDGEETRACTRDNCDYTETRKIPKLDHTHEYTETVIEPTCTTKGYTLHKCECGDEYKDNETEALGHLFGEWKVTTPATEEEDGLKERACARCGEKEKQSIPAKPHAHKFVDTVIEPTCTGKGYTIHKCKCGEQYEDSYVSALGHSFTNYVSGGNATCTKDGTKTAKCDRCDEIKTIADEGSAKGHKPSDYISDREPTCTETGSKHKECTVCGETLETVEVPAKGHSFTNYVSDGNATCTQDGTKTAKCDRCDETKTIADEGSAKGHKPSDYISDKEPTCTEAGSKHKECTVCGETLETAEVPAKGHDYSAEWTIDKEATCTKNGIKSRHCTHCSSTIYGEIEKTQHNFVYKEAQPVDCTEDGNIAYWYCTECGKYYADKDGNREISFAETVITAKHNLIHHEAKEATCATIGWNEYDTCSRCGYTTYKEISKKAHKYGSWSITKEATNLDYGQKVRVCSVCRNRETATVEKITAVKVNVKLRHNFVSGFNVYPYIDQVLITKSGSDYTVSVTIKWEIKEFTFLHCDATMTGGYSYTDSWISAYAGQGQRTIQFTKVTSGTKTFNVKLKVHGDSF